MRNIIFILCNLLLLPTLYAQQYYMRFALGAKTEFYNAFPIGTIQMKRHIDAGAGFYLGRVINVNWSMEAGLIKNDYAAKFSFEGNDFDQGQKLTYFEDIIYPTFNSYQISLMPVYSRFVSNNAMFYTRLGLQFYLSRSLSREGSEQRAAVLYNEHGDQVATMTLITYANSLDVGSFFIRGDAGLQFGISENFILDLGVSAKGSNLVHNIFLIELKENSGTYILRREISSKGAGLALNIGIVYFWEKK